MQNSYRPRGGGYSQGEQGSSSNASHRDYRQNENYRNGRGRGFHGQTSYQGSNQPNRSMSSSNYQVSATNKSFNQSNRSHSTGQYDPYGMANHYHQRQQNEQQWRGRSFSRGPSYQVYAPQSSGRGCHGSGSYSHAAPQQPMNPRGRGQNRGNASKSRRDCSQHQFQHNRGNFNQGPSNMNKSFGGYLGEEGDDSVFLEEPGQKVQAHPNRYHPGRSNRVRQAGGYRNNLDMNKSFGGYLQNGNSSVLDHGAHQFGQHRQSTRGRRQQRGNKNNMNKSFDQRREHSVPQKHHQMHPNELAQKVSKMTVHDKPSASATNSKMPVKTVPPKKSGPKKRAKKATDSLNHTLPARCLDETMNDDGVNLNHTIGGTVPKSILKREGLVRTKSVVFATPPTPRDLWSPMRTRITSSVFGLTPKKSKENMIFGEEQPKPSSLFNFEQELVRPPMWKHSVKLHVHEMIVVNTDAQFVGFYMIHCGMMNPMPDLIVKEGGLFFLFPNTKNLMKMPPSFLFNVYPTEEHALGELVAGRYYYLNDVDNDMVDIHTVPNKFTISNLPEGLLDPHKYNPEVKSKKYLDMVLAEFAKKKDQSTQSASGSGSAPKPLPLPEPVVAEATVSTSEPPVAVEPPQVKTPVVEASDQNACTPQTRSGKKRRLEFTPLRTSTPRKSNQQKDSDERDVKKPKSSERRVQREKSDSVYTRWGIFAETPRVPISERLAMRSFSRRRDPFGESPEELACLNAEDTKDSTPSPP
uniref:Trithorax group protein osa n=1 Tax=Caenorhabditis tropicalis TaxID=1561998 RepID=A0A1I7U1Y7_9PELO